MSGEKTVLGNNPRGQRQLGYAVGNDIEVRRLLGGLLDGRHVAHGAGVVRQVELCQARVAQDGGQQVVEVVGDTAGENAQALELLRVLELLLEAR